MIAGKTLYATDGETLAVAQQWAAECEKRGTTVSGVTWAYTGSGALSGQALAGTKATALLAPTGCGTLTCTATLANGEVLVTHRAVLLT